MKNKVRLILVISTCFTVVFLLSLVLTLLQLRIESVRAIPVLSRMQLQEFIAAAQKSFPVTIYLSILLGISYTARRGVSIPASIICVMSLGMGAALVISLGITMLENIPVSPSSGKGIVLGEPGLIFSYDDRVTVFLEDPGDTQSSQVIALPDQPLIYQKMSIEPLGTTQGFGSALLQSTMYFFLDSILRDFNFTSAQFINRAKDGFILFIIYIASLIFVLSSLRFIMNLSVWPLANLFLGILAFRGILSLDRLFNSEGIQRFIISFTGDWFPKWVISPLVFCILGVLIIFATMVIHLGKNRRIDENF